MVHAFGLHDYIVGIGMGLFKLSCHFLYNHGVLDSFLVELWIVGRFWI